jgi:hypothetical protein
MVIDRKKRSPRKGFYTIRCATDDEADGREQPEWEHEVSGPQRLMHSLDANLRAMSAFQVSV